jgi:patatin-related protein
MAAAVPPPQSVVARDEELRIALVMNGGVSLAVWMGGVAYEINRFIGETHPVYESLLELTRTKARVDVISGASAGGINGAALAMGHVYDTSLYGLRDVWLESGALDGLLRDAGEADPPSLLDGDNAFLPALTQAFASLVQGRSGPVGEPDEMPIDLSLAATRLSGRKDRIVDDLGSIIEDLVHRTRFHFERKADDDPFTKPDELVTRLAKAARSSASFPVAFEPSLCDGATLQNVVDFKDRQYLIDGGVLDNKPLDHALRAIFAMPAHGNVRRVLAYVVPDPSVGPAAPEAPANAAADAPPPMPALGEVALASLITIPSAQSISAQLEAIKQQNAEIGKHRRTLSTIVANTPPDRLAAMAFELFQAYRRRRIDGLIDSRLDVLEKEAGRGGESASLGRNAKQWLRAVWMRGSDMTAPSDPFIPTDATELGVDPASGRWHWGEYTLQFLVSILFDLLRRTQRLRHLTVREAPSPALPAGHAGDPAASSATPTDWEGLDVAIRNRRLQSPETRRTRESGADDDPLPGLWRRAYEVNDEVRSLEPGKYTEQTTELAQRLLARLHGGERSDVPEGAHERGAEASDEALARKWLAGGLADMRAMPPSPEVDAGLAEMRALPPAARADARDRRLAAAAVKLGDIVAKLQPEIRRIIDSAPPMPFLRKDDAAALLELTRYHEYVYAGGVEAAAIVRQLLILEVVHYAVSHRQTQPDVAFELVQVSAQQRSPWGGGATPAEKLAGMQLAHFGGFYKKSWRANDWMNGRLDAIDRLVRIGLSPERLHRCYGGRIVNIGGTDVRASDYVHAFLRVLAVDRADASQRALLDQHWIDDAVRSELAFLDSPDARVPDVLSACCDALVRRLQLEVICRELPDVAAAVSDDLVAGARADSTGAALARRLGVGERRGDAANGANARSPAELVRLFDTHRVGSERLGDEAGSDMFTRTVSHAVAVAHSAATGERSGTGVLGALLKSVKLPVYVFYLLANRLRDDSRAAAAVTTSLLIAGLVAVVASALVTSGGDAIAALGWALLVGWFGAALIRGRLAAVVLSAILIGALVWMLHPGWLAASGVAVLLLVALYYGPGWLGAVLFALIAAWITTGTPEPMAIVATVCDDLPRALGCTTARDVKPARLFVSLAELMLLIVLIAALAQRLSARRRH